MVERRRCRLGMKKAKRYYMKCKLGVFLGCLWNLHYVECFNCLGIYGTLPGSRTYFRLSNNANGIPTRSHTRRKSEGEWGEGRRAKEVNMSVFINNQCFLIFSVLQSIKCWESPSIIRSDSASELTSFWENKNTPALSTIIIQEMPKSLMVFRFDRIPLLDETMRGRESDTTKWHYNSILRSHFHFENSRKHFVVLAKQKSSHFHFLFSNKQQNNII